MRFFSFKLKSSMCIFSLKTGNTADVVQNTADKAQNIADKAQNTVIRPRIQLVRPSCVLGLIL